MEYTILVVEDEKPLLAAIQGKLERGGFKVVVAREVNEAITHLESNIKIDVIWLDHYLLGKENGLDLVTKVKSGENSTWKNIPIFVVSNTASPEKVQSYIRFGVNKYYTKAEHRLDEIISDISDFLRNPNE